jgi:DNA-binding LacI/PurR family transcriptional regulator
MTDMAVGALQSRGIEDFAIMDIEPPKPSDDESIRHMRNYDLLESAVGHRSDRIVYVKRSIDFSHAYDAFKEWWARSERPNAIFFYDDVLCNVATRAIMDLNIKVPEELSIITHGNKNRRFYFPVPLTRIEFDPEEVMSLAWNMLHRLIVNLPVDEPVVYVKPHILKGESI